MIPRQLLQSFNAPFFGILIKVASFQSSGILLSSQTFIMRGRRISAAIAGSVLKSSALRLSGPGALLFFKALIVLIISSLEGGGVSISRSSTATGMSGSVSGGGRFNISLKYSAHRAIEIKLDYVLPQILINVLKGFNSDLERKTFWVHFKWSLLEPFPPCNLLSFRLSRLKMQCCTLFYFCPLSCRES